MIRLHDTMAREKRAFDFAAQGSLLVDESHPAGNPGPSATATCRRARCSRSRTTASAASAASMDEGWTRWILEQFEFPFNRVFAPELDAGNLNAKYDALIFVDGAIPDNDPRNPVE